MQRYYIFLRYTNFISKNLENFIFICTYRRNSVPLHSKLNKPMNPDRKTIEVVAAIIRDEEGRIFATQRGYGEWKDWWEFPGGKIEPGESREQALQREIREELAAEIEVGQLLRTIDYDYPNFHLTMYCFLCRLIGNVTLLEHEAARWLAPSELTSVRWLPADIELIEELKSL